MKLEINAYNFKEIVKIIVEKVYHDKRIKTHKHRVCINTWKTHMRMQNTEKTIDENILSNNLIMKIFWHIYFHQQWFKSTCGAS